MGLVTRPMAEGATPRAGVCKNCGRRYTLLVVNQKHDYVVELEAAKMMFAAIQACECGNGRTYDLSIWSNK